MSNFPDGGGGLYSDDYTSLKSTTTNAETVIINSKTRIIKGSQSVYAFQPCKNTLLSFSFGSSPSLEIIEDYSFSQCIKLQSIDLSLCTKLIKIGSYAFSRCSSCISIKLPNSVTNLGQNVFELNKIQRFDLPSAITSLPYMCFFSCSSLTEINIPQDSSLTNIEKWFIRKTSITSFRIPTRVDTLSDGIFEDSKLETVMVSKDNPNYEVTNNLLIDKRTKYCICCPPKTTGNIVVPQGVVVISSSSFRSCTIDSVQLPSTLNSIWGYAFAESSITSIDIPDAVIGIGVSAFNGCKRLSSVKFPASLNFIDQNAFYGTHLSHLEFPSGLKTLNSGCFMNCPNLKEVELPEGIAKLNGQVFDSGVIIHFNPKSNFYIDDQFLILDKQNTTVSQYIGSNSDVSIRFLSSISTINTNAFKGNNNIKSFIFPPDSALSTINIGAFSGCSSATFENLPTKISFIGNSAFLDCIRLKSLVFTSSLKNLSSNSFYNCSSLKEVHIEDSSITSLPSSCFSLCKSITSIIIPNTATSIDSSCFLGCTSLTTVQFGASLKSIEQSSFQSCNISTLDLLSCKSLVNISDYAFAYNKYLSLIILPENIERFGAYSFTMTSLTNMTIPSHLVSLGPYSFSECGNLDSLTIPSNSELDTNNIGIGSFKNCFRIRSIQCDSSRFSVFNGALFNKAQTSLILFPPASATVFFSLPPTTRTINEGAFMSCLNLISIFIPSDSLTLISNNAFEGCSSLSWINIPICVSNIGKDVFLGCNSLNCGLEIENKNKDFRKNLVKISKLNSHCLSKCSSVYSCKCNEAHMNINLIQPFIVMLI